MSTSSRAHLWMESLGDWSWPGTAAAAEILPPSWVPAFPPRLDALAAGAGAGAWQPERGRARRLWLGGLMSAVAALAVGAAAAGPARLQGLLGQRAAATPAFAVATTPARSLWELPNLNLYSGSLDGSGSAILSTSYTSPALHGRGAFYVYVPPGYAGTDERYPVLYLLHGNSQSATAFLQIGIQEELDRLIRARAIPPMLAVMIQGGPGANNWRNWGGRDYESYVLEVQELVDALLPTIRARDARAIAGLSMGGYGAMNLALGNPYRFGVVESWLGFFNGLDGELRDARPVISRLGLHAFLYGAESDRIADPFENAPFAHALRAEGASATGAIYPGEHSLQTVQAHLASMLTFAGHTLASSRAQPAPHPRGAAHARS